jgi:hypothetical protein
MIDIEHLEQVSQLALCQVHRLHCRDVLSFAGTLSPSLLLEHDRLLKCLLRHLVFSTQKKSLLTSMYIDVPSKHIIVDVEKQEHHR